MPVFQLTERLAFPAVTQSEPDGLLAVGGDLSPERLLFAYSLGIFPWYGEGEPILWWSPDPRCVLFTDEVHVSRRLQRTMNRQEFTVTCNRAFERCVELCARVRLDLGQETWLVPEMQAAYRRLHQVGYAHSIEAWQDGELVGGMYGVALGPFFFGESMFHLRTDASKVVMVKLARHLAGHGGPLIDCQVCNPHLLSMGARNIPRGAFLSGLEAGGVGPAGDWARRELPEEL